jgi:hypothetical protein
MLSIAAPCGESGPGAHWVWIQTPKADSCRVTASAFICPSSPEPPKPPGRRGLGWAAAADGNFSPVGGRTTDMKVSPAALTVLLAVIPLAANAQYDPTADQATVGVLNERIDGDVNQGLLPTDRAALMRAEIEAAQKLVTNKDSQATAMLADIDRDLAAYDHTVDSNEANRDLFYHTGDAITIAMRDGVAWQVDNVQNTDIMNLKNPNAMNPPGVQGIYLAKQPGYTGISLTDPASGKKVRFRFYIVDKAVAN